MDDPCKSLDYILPIRESQSMMLPPFAYSRRPIVNVTRRFTERIKYKYEHESSLNEGRISKLYWLPDGKWLFFTQNEYIRHVNLDGYGNSRRRAGAYDDQSRAAPQRLFIDQDSEREFIAKGVVCRLSPPHSPDCERVCHHRPSPAQLPVCLLRHLQREARRLRHLHRLRAEAPARGTHPRRRPSVGESEGDGHGHRLRALGPEVRRQLRQVP